MNKVLIIDDDKELCALIKRSVLKKYLEEHADEWNEW